MRTSDLVEAYEALKTIDRAHPYTLQDHALNRLLWYLNSGGKRSYHVEERPDQDERREPRPDYVCRDTITGGYITMEITRILHHRNELKVETHKIRLWHLIAKRLGNTLGGQFTLETPIQLNTRGVDLNQLAGEIAGDIIQMSKAMSAGSKVTLSKGLRLVKLKNEGSLLLPPVTLEEEDESVQDPIMLMNFDQIVRAIEQPLEEANRKLCTYSKGTRMLLLDAQFYPDTIDSFEAIREIEKEHFPCIDRLYVLNVDHRGNIIRLW